MKNLSQITFSPEIVEARAQNLPIVALESTIISHGLPYPDNIETAKKLEKARLKMVFGVKKVKM